MSASRAQRLLDEFNEGAARAGAIGGFSARHGLAAVLRHIADTEGDPESWDAVPFWRLEQLADALTATVLDRAMAGDANAARQFLREAGFTDASGNWLPQYQPESGDA